MKGIVNWNTLFLSIGFSLLGWMGNKMTEKIDLAHDDIIAIKSTMVPRAEYLTELTTIKLRITALELEVIQMKDRSNR